MSIDSFRNEDYISNLENNRENNRENNEKQESKLEKKERQIIFGLKQKGITYRGLKLKIRELEENKRTLREFPDDEELRKKVEKLEKAINSQAIIIKAKEGDTLRNLCKDYYGKGSVSTIILIPKLGYKEKIKIGENLPLPLKKYILPLIKVDLEIKGDSGDKKEETTTHLEPTSKPKQAEENKTKQAEQAEYEETTEQIETSFDEMKELVEQTDKLENNFENKLNIFAL